VIARDQEIGSQGQTLLGLGYSQHHVRKAHQLGPGTDRRAVKDDHHWLGDVDAWKTR
jgi:hypothetical protein